MPDITDRFLFEVKGVSQALRVVRLFGQEGMSELFQFELTIACEDSGLAFADMVGAPALLSILIPEEETRFVHGLVSRFEQGNAGRKLSTYQVTLVPHVFRLQHRHDCRIFQELTTPEIVKNVLESAGLRSGDDYRLSVQGSFSDREYCVQYRESDWAFISRLLEEDGLYYFFEHHEDKHVLVIVDRAASHAPIAGKSTVLFRPPLGALGGGEHVQRFHYAEQIRSDSVTVRDYDFKKPDLRLEGKSADPATKALEIFDYPARFEVPSAGTAIAKVRLEQHQMLRRVGEGDSACARFVPGQLFTLAEHARESFNREYLITRVEHHGIEPSMGDATEAEVRYENRFQVIPSDVPFRAPETTPKPVVRGLQSAVVVGPASEEIYTDAHGRVKVQFYWDRLGEKDEKSSCWLRVAQISAGEAFGAMVLPRIKQEVLVDFLEGDPDRPIVIGSVYHGTNVPPYALPANKTRTTLKTNSTPGGGGSNELRFEDKKGSEEVYLHGQKDWTIAIEHDQNATVGHDETLDVTNDRSMAIGNDETFSVGNNRIKSIGKDESESIGQNRSIEVGADHTESIGGSLALSVGKGQSLDVGEDASESIGTTKIVKVGQDYEIEIGSNAKSKVSGSSASKVELEAKVEVGSKITIVCGDSKVTIGKDGSIKVEGKSFEVNASGPVKVEADKVDVKSSGEVKIEASGKVEVKGSGPMELNASGAVKVKGANVGIN